MTALDKIQTTGRKRLVALCQVTVTAIGMDSFKGYLRYGYGLYGWGNRSRIRYRDKHEYRASQPIENPFFFHKNNVPIDPGTFENGAKLYNIFNHCK